MKKTPPITENLDKVIHERVRLGIMTILMTQGEADFTELKKTLALTDGNLSAHMRVLKESGYVSVTKQFVGNRPRTTYRITDSGKQAFEEYIDSMELFLKGISRSE